MEQTNTLSLPELSDRCAELYINYFAEKRNKEIRDQYNIAAQEYNKRTGRNDMVIITSNTKDNVTTQKGEARLFVEEQNIIIKKKDKSAAKEKEIPSTTIKSGGTVAKIIELHKSGLSNKQIIEMNFNKNTVNRQISEYKKSIQK